MHYYKQILFIYFSSEWREKLYLNDIERKRVSELVSECECVCVCERERERERDRETEEGLHRQFEYYFSFVFRLWLVAAVAAVHLNKINFEFDESEKEF